MPKSLCSSCGKGGDRLKVCNSCKEAKYCNSTCQRRHWKTHKKECRKRAAYILDEALFKEPPPRDECPICLVFLPCASLCNYQTCCGKEICNGCVESLMDVAVADILQGNVSREKGLSKTDCPFCREPCHDTDEEAIERVRKHVEIKKGVELGRAIHFLAYNYLNGTMSLPQDTRKSFELWVQAAELGSVDACNSLAISYMNGRGVEVDMKKCIHYTQVAAMGGHTGARYNLGYFEEESGNSERAAKHYMIAARSGFERAMDAVQRIYLSGSGAVSVEDIAVTFKTHVDYKNEVNTDARKKSAATAF